MVYGVVHSIYHVGYGLGREALNLFLSKLPAEHGPQNFTD